MARAMFAIAFIVIIIGGTTTVDCHIRAIVPQYNNTIRIRWLELYSWLYYQLFTIIVLHKRMMHAAIIRSAHTTTQWDCLYLSCEFRSMNR